MNGIFASCFNNYFTRFTEELIVYQQPCQAKE